MLVYFCFELPAQYSTKRMLNKETGLPGIEVTHLIEDDEGILWMIVDGNELCQFDGYQLKCFDRKETGMSGGTYSITFKYGIIQCSPHDRSHLIVFQNGVWKRLEKPAKNDKIYNAFLIPGEDTYRMHKWTGSNWEAIPWLTNSLVDSLYNEYGTISIFIPSEIYGNEFCEIILVDRQVVYTDCSKLEGGQYYGSYTFLGKDKKLYYLNKNKALKEIASGIDKDFIHGGGVIGSTWNKGIKVNILNGKTVDDKLFDRGISIEYCESSGLYAMGSHQGAYINEPSISFFKAGNDGLVNNTHIVGEDNVGNIWFGGYRTGLSKWDGNTLSPNPPFKNRLDFLMTGRVVLEDSTLIFLTEEYNFSPKVLAIKNGLVNVKAIHLEDDYKTACYDIRPISEDRICIGTSQGGLGIIDANLLFTDEVRLIDEEEGNLISNIFCAVEDQQQRIWGVSQSAGLMIYDYKRDTALTFFVKDHPKLSSGLTALYYDHMGHLWIGGYDGLWVIRNAAELDIYTHHPFDLMEKVELWPKASVTSSILAYDERYMVVAAEEAVYFIDYREWEQSDNFTAYTYTYGYDIEGGSSEENGMMVDSRGDLWVGTQEGYLCFHMDRLKFDTTIINLGLSEIIIGDSTYTIDSPIIELPSSNRNFAYSFSLDANPSLRNNIFVYTTLVQHAGRDTLFEERYEPGRELNRIFLEPGKYDFIVRTYKNNRLIDQDTYLVTAKAELAENWWFWPLIAGVALGLIAYYQYRLSERRRHELALADKQRQTQLQAVISSFNPHFINNSLQWAQSRSLNDPLMTKVISRLSDNISHIFMHTKEGKAYHSLREELRLVENYVVIQLERFSHRFTYHPPKLEKTDPLLDTWIPIMQIQIHVENAIEESCFVFICRC